jgi:two-component system, NarL family, sensor histidine kinase UhpB
MSLILSITFVMLATLILGSVMTYLHALNKVDTEMKAAIAVGGRIALNAVDDVEEGSNAKRRLQLLVADFDGDRHLRAFVTDDHGKVLLTSALAQPEEPVPSWFYWLLKGKPQSIDVDLPVVFDSHGQLTLETNSLNEVGEVWDEVSNTLTLLLAFCTMITGLVTFTLGRALRPLGDLARAFTEIASPYLSPRLPEGGPIELKRVYRGFNEMADRLAATEEQNRNLEDQLATVQEEERAEIARDLHDEIGPFLFAADVDAASLQKVIESGSNEDIESRVTKIRESVVHMQRHVRDMLGRLRAAPLVDLGLQLAIEKLVSFWKGRNSDTTFHVNVPPESFGEPLDSTIYRIVQESLSNAIRHGRPKTVKINVASRDTNILITVEDDGSGLRTSQGRTGFGIKGMRERVARLEGELHIANREDGTGVRVTARLPHKPIDPPATTTQKLEEAGT